MSRILSTLIERLRPYSLAELENIATAAGVAKDVPRKLRSGERTNPTLRNVERLLDYFEKLDRANRPPMARMKGVRRA